MTGDMPAALLWERYGPLPEAIRERPDVARRHRRVLLALLDDDRRGFNVPTDEVPTFAKDVLALRRWKWSGRQIAALLCVDEKYVTGVIRRHEREPEPEPWDET